MQSTRPCRLHRRSPSCCNDRYDGPDSAENCLEVASFFLSAHTGFVAEDGAASLVVDNGDKCMAGIAGDDAYPAVFPLFLGRPNIHGILVGMEVKDSLLYDAGFFVHTVQKPVEAPQVQFLATLWMCLSLCNDSCVVRWCGKLWLFRSCSSSTVVDSPFVPQRQLHMVPPFRKTMEFPQLQYVSWWSVHLLCKSFSMPVVPQARMVQTLLNSVTLGGDCQVTQTQFNAGVCGHSLRNMCVAGLFGPHGGGDEGILLQFCSICRTPSSWTSSARVAGTPGV